MMKMKPKMKTTGGTPVIPQGYKDGGKVGYKDGGKAMMSDKKKSPTMYMNDGGMVRATGSMAPNECTYNGGPGVRSMQDYKK